VGLFALNGALGGVVRPALLVAAGAWGAWIAARSGSGLWPTDWPLLAQVPLALIAAELVEYSYGFSQLPTR